MRGEVPQRRGGPTSVHPVSETLCGRLAYANQAPPEPFAVTRKQRVAVVGAGPAGLSLRLFPCKDGVQDNGVRGPFPRWGMLDVALPEFRLPKRCFAEK